MDEHAVAGDEDQLLLKQLLGRGATGGEHGGASALVGGQALDPRVLALLLGVVLEALGVDDVLEVEGDVEDSAFSPVRR